MFRYRVTEKRRVGNRNMYEVMDKLTGQKAVFNTEVIKTQVKNGSIENMKIKNGCLVFVSYTNPFLIEKNNKVAFNTKHSEFFKTLFKFYEEDEVEMLNREEYEGFMGSIEDARLVGEYHPATWNEPSESPELEVDVSDFKIVVNLPFNYKKLFDKSKSISNFVFTRYDLLVTLESYLDMLLENDDEFGRTLSHTYSSLEVLLDNEEYGDCLKISSDDYNINEGETIKTTTIQATYLITLDEDKLYEKLSEKY